MDRQSATRLNEPEMNNWNLWNLRNPWNSRNPWNPWHVRNPGNLITIVAVALLCAALVRAQAKP